LRCFSALANTLHSHQLDILSWYRFPISTGPLEGLNNKIKVLKRQAYGFRDLEYFKLRLAFIGSSTHDFPDEPNMRAVLAPLPLSPSAPLLAFRTPPFPEVRASRRRA